ncbi:pilus assembly protein TadG-related protein [Agromyces hippuratus]|uniref:pilus assembly protein TadG-related protein n=1 Tax=Agromyces hippuratus TaxID=286438 RepID=UPI0035E4F1EE
MKHHLRRLIRSERGANAVLIVFLLVPMMGFGALALDVSAQHAERQQIQRGVDAAAIAVASSCARDEGTCAAGSTALSTEFLEANNGTPVAGEVESAVPNTDDNEVQVVASADFPHFFASLIDGDSDPNSTTVRADATAEWGNPISGGTFVLAFGYCEFLDATPGALILVQNNTTERRDCEGTFARGGFGWLVSPDCTVEINIADPWVDGTTGAAGSGICSDVLHTDPERNAYLESMIGTVQLVPIYDDCRRIGTVSSGAGDCPGANNEFHLITFAAFRITGMVFPGINRPDPAAPPCTRSCTGIQGEFIEYVELGDGYELGDAPDGGVTIVRLKD